MIKQLIEEYGGAILIIVAIVILVAMATPIGEIVKSAIFDLLGNLTGTVGVEEETTTAMISLLHLA